MTNITWGLLVKIEPRLGEMLKRAKAVKGDGEHFCANTVWYDDFKPELCTLVGWEASGTNPLLHTPQAYDLAYRKIYETLPDCRDCTCM